MNPTIVELAANWPEDPKLMDVEKEQLRALTYEGGPLARIIKTTLDYCKQLEQAIAACDLDGEEGLKLARQLQLKRNASLGFVQWFVQLYAEPRTTPSTTHQTRNAP